MGPCRLQIVPHPHVLLGCEQQLLCPGTLRIKAVAHNWQKRVKFRGEKSDVGPFAHKRDFASPAEAPGNREMSLLRTQIQIWVRAGRGYRRRCVPLVMNLTLRAIPRSGGAPQAEKCPRLRTQIRIWVLGGPKSRFGSEVVGTSRSAQRILAARSTPGLSCSSINTTSPSGPHGGGPKSGFGS